ncbi:DUF397 domain-containing protein [Streptomyces sp. DSM 41014]|uniref:DUF397 domain-containing protein n=1 Tax=Streptomyces hintoniae TaxID=3075521 RepID=A0ABU2UD39_9ACTN|nr:DUF397 domain-containing protein [Streptomyces sp. DSM 41014]MDT0471134.1 DUF397 domain-containing protein [Streptomyces sp. DSM 41014]
MTATETPRWLTSSHSNNGGACVEVAVNLGVSHGIVPVRHSKDSGGPELRFASDAFAGFVAGVKGSFGVV